MRYFKKKQDADYPSIFKDWLSENRCAIDEWISNKNGNEIWDEFGKSFGRETETQINPVEVRNKLLDTLYDEQNGLCCYCGNKIERKRDESKHCWEYRNYAIEHFQPKKHRKDLIFSYSNLMLTCKESKVLKRYVIGKNYNGNTIKSISDIARIVDIPEEKIREHNGDADKAYPHGTEVKVPHPTHCDDSKSGFDCKTHPTAIVDPSLNAHIQYIDRFQFLPSGEIDFIRNNDDEIIEKSIEVLQLNCDTLKDRRKNKWNNVERYFTENFTYLLDDIEILRASINQLIDNLGVPNADNELEPFYFVEVAFYKNLYPSQP